MSKIQQLWASGQTIFTLDDLSVIWGQQKRTDTSASAKQYARTGQLVRLHRGVYALPHKALSPQQIAGKLVAPSYLTGESILRKSGASFQFSPTVTSAALTSRQIELGETPTTYRYSQLEPAIFYHPLGVEKGEASLERAVADLVYLTGGRYRFEDLSAVNWDKLAQIGQIYGKKSVLRHLARLREQHHA